MLTRGLSHSIKNNSSRIQKSIIIRNKLLSSIQTTAIITNTVIVNEKNSNKMMFKINSSSTVAAAATTIATLATLSTTTTIAAFTPSNIMTRYTTSSSSSTSSKHLSYNNNFINKRFLSSSVMEDQDTKNKNTNDNDNQIMSLDHQSKVIATAIAKSFIPSPNGYAGVMAVKLMEEDYDPNYVGNKDDNSSAPKVEGDEALLSQTGMFGGNMNKKTSSKSIEVEDLVGKAVKYSNGRTGTIIVQRPPMAFVLCDFAEWDNEESSSEEIISIMSSRTSIPVNNKLFGKIVDCYGRSDDDNNRKEDGDDTLSRAIFAPIPQIKDIALINSPLLTGTSMIDALAPIGKGQNMLFIGQDTGVGQRDVLIGAIKTQVNMGKTASSVKGVKCVYALTAQDKKVKEEVLQRLKEEDLLDHIVVVAARDHGCDNEVLASAEAITTAASACSIAETLALSQGLDAFVVVDDIDDHKSFWDWTTRVLVEIYGVDAVVEADINGGASSEMRGFYSSLIQRAGRFNQKNGNGSMTLALLTNLAGKFGSDNEDDVTFSEDDFADSSEKIRQRIAILVNKNIPLTPETLRKIQIPVPVASESEKERRLALQHVDDLVSMSDGQVWFDEKLYANGQRPAIDPQQSITRVGVGADTPCRADAPAMRGLAGGLRFDFAQAASLEGADKNSGADKQLLKRDAYLLAMHQSEGDVRLLSENCVALMAASLGLLNNIVAAGGKAGSKLGNETIQGLLDHMKENVPHLMEDIDNTLDLTPSVRFELEDAIKQYLS